MSLRVQRNGLIGGRPFTPRQLASVAEWINTDDPSTFTLGGGSVINSVTGAIASRIGTPGAVKPTYSATGQVGTDGVSRPGMVFAGGARLSVAVNPLYAGTRRLTWMAVVSSTIGNTTTGVLAEAGSASAIAGNGRNGLFLNAEAAANPGSLYVGGRGGGSACLTRSYPYRGSLAEPTVVCVTFVQSSSGLSSGFTRLRLDNVDQRLLGTVGAVGPGLSPDVFANEPFQLGARGDETLPTPCVISHPIWYLGDSDTEIRRLSAWLASKAGTESQG
jgi:hypothetical protein